LGAVEGLGMEDSSRSAGSFNLVKPGALQWLFGHEIRRAIWRFWSPAVPIGWINAWDLLFWGAPLLYF